MIQFLQCVDGYKTYIMIALTALDAVGVAQGWWEEGKVREIAEFALTGAAYRSGVSKRRHFPTRRGGSRDL